MDKISFYTLNVKKLIKNVRFFNFFENNFLTTNILIQTTIYQISAMVN